MDTITIFPNQEDLFQAAAIDFKERAKMAIKHNGFFSVALSGGNTPKEFFLQLAKMNDIEWNKIIFFFSDERYVSKFDNESNYHTAYSFLFSKVPIDKNNIYPIPTDFSDPNEAAVQYEKILNDQLQKRKEPLFDLIYLGLGDNGHTASLMPQSTIVKHYCDKHVKNGPLVAALWVPELNMYRITLTPSAINNSDAIIFLVTGKNKQDAVWNVLKGPYNPLHYPAQLILYPNKNVLWFLDSAAAEKIM